MACCGAGRRQDQLFNAETLYGEFVDCERFDCSFFGGNGADGKTPDGQRADGDGSHRESARCERADGCGGFGFHVTPQHARYEISRPVGGGTSAKRGDAGFEAGVLPAGMAFEPTRCGSQWVRFFDCGFGRKLLRRYCDRAEWLRFFVYAGLGFFSLRRAPLKKTGDWPGQRVVVVIRADADGITQTAGLRRHDLPFVYGDIGFHNGFVW